MNETGRLIESRSMDASGSNSSGSISSAMPARSTDSALPWGNQNDAPRDGWDRAEGTPVNELEQKKLEAEIANLNAQTEKALAGTRRVEDERASLQRSWQDWSLEAGEPCC